MADKRLSKADDLFLRSMVFAEEDRHRHTCQSWDVGSYRWFKSGNIFPIEHYRRSASPEPAPKSKPAA
jgi:hypothetical protein